MNRAEEAAGKIERGHCCCFRESEAFTVRCPGLADAIAEAIQLAMSEEREACARWIEQAPTSDMFMDGIRAWVASMIRHRGSPA